MSSPNNRVIRNKESNNSNNVNTTIATSSNKEGDNNNGSSKAPKKKKPIQHLLAGGTAGFVESSVCHPLDTIKTRMQLRRQNTLKGRALGSLRDVAGGNNHRALGSLREVAIGGTALHRTAADPVKSTAIKSEGGAKAVLNDGNKSSKGLSTKSETVRVKPDLSKAKSAAPTSSSPSSNNALHDVGWKQRLPPKATSVATTASKSTPSFTTSAAAASSSSLSSSTVVAPLGPFGTARRIVQREGPMALYKGLTAVYTGIVPKMAIRFVSFEYYRDVLGGWYRRYNNNNGSGNTSGDSASSTSMPPPPPPAVTFLAGLLSGLTEAVAIVTPAEVCKIRMQSQYHSLMDPSQMAHAKYKNVVQTAVLVAREEGLGALYKGVVPTMLRQGCNQAVNFTVYNWSKKQILAWKKKKNSSTSDGKDDTNVQLDHWQSLVLGGLSGGMGPLVNNPLDVVKTRMQKQVIHPGKEPKYKSLLQSCVVIAKEEGTPALWKGITPRLMRIMPGQAITFMTYEAVSAQMEKYGLFD